MSVMRRRPRLTYAATRSSFASSIRLGLLLTAALISPLVGADDAETLRYLAVVIVLALFGSSVPDTSRAKLPVLLAESVLTAVGIVATADPSLPLLVCLPSTTIAAGLSRGYLGTAVTGGAAAAILLVGRALRSDEPQVAAAFSSLAAQWILVALVSGILAARIHGLSTVPTTQDRYAEAHRLLAQLRGVTRGLAGSLDPGTVAQTLLERATVTSGAAHGAVLLHVGGDQLVPLALHGYRRVPWRANLAEDGPITRAWLAGAPVVDRRQPDPDGGRAGSTLLVLPILVDRNRVGVLTLEWRLPSTFDTEHLPELQALVADSALPLETAALFDELRIAAATEERSRLAREMHDGIAQDLAFLGYQLDALTAVLRRSGVDEAVEQARALRGHITSLISDLRLSISDLRSSVGPGRGLGAALSEYARSAGTSSGIRVHLSLKEGSTRLPADTEVQLLRIAHEAVGRARRRPGTRNLWVTLDADPPQASLVVEDDAPNTDESIANGETAARSMDERALKLGARFRAEHRLPTGNRISVDVGGSEP